MRRTRTARVSYTIERGRGATYAHAEGFTVYGHDRYPRGSVLAGMDRRTYVDTFPTVETARAAYPTADVIAGTTYRDVDAMVAHLPDGPDW